MKNYYLLISILVLILGFSVLLPNISLVTDVVKSSITGKANLDLTNFKILAWIIGSCGFAAGFLYFIHVMTQKN